jgi:hypothetical protein
LTIHTVVSHNTPVNDKNLAHFTCLSVQILERQEHIATSSSLHAFRVWPLLMRKTHH